MDKYTKRSNRKGVRRSPALRMVKISRAGPGHIRNTTVWDKGQGHTRAYRARVVLVAATSVLRKRKVRLHTEVRAGVTI